MSHDNSLAPVGGDGQYQKGENSKLEKFKEIINRKPKDAFDQMMGEPKKHLQQLIEDVGFLQSINKK